MEGAVQSCLVLGIVAIAPVTSGLQQSITEFSLPQSNFGKGILHNFLEYLPASTISNCAKECFYIKRCKSFTYKRTQKKCVLNPINATEARPVDWQKEVDNLIFSDKMDWPKALAGSCADEPCSMTEKCLPGNPPTCIGYCGAVDSYHKGWFNGGCAVTGCVRRFACKEGYVSKSLGTITTLSSTCQADGAWSPIQVECIADCGAPPAVAHAIVGPGLETEKAIRNYTCQPGYTASSVVTSIECQASSNWTIPDFTCN